MIYREREGGEEREQPKRISKAARHRQFVVPRRLYKVLA